MSRASDLQATPELCIEPPGGQGFIFPIRKPAAFCSLSISQLARPSDQMNAVKVFPCIAW